MCFSFYTFNQTWLKSLYVYIDKFDFQTFKHIVFNPFKL